MLAEYKVTIDGLTKEMDAIGGGDPRSLGSGRSRKQLAEEAEMERAAKIESQKGIVVKLYYSCGHPTDWFSVYSTV